MSVGRRIVENDHFYRCGLDAQRHLNAIGKGFSEGAAQGDPPRASVGRMMLLDNSVVRLYIRYQTYRMEKRAWIE